MKTATRSSNKPPNRPYSKPAPEAREYPKWVEGKGFLWFEGDPGAPIDPETGKPMEMLSRIDPREKGAIWRLSDPPRVIVESAKPEQPVARPGAATVSPKKSAESTSTLFKSTPKKTAEAF